MQRAIRRQGRRIVMWYVIVAIVWIVYTDMALGHVVPLGVSPTLVSVLKGALFVGVTGALLHLLIARLLAAEDQAVRELRASEARFQAFMDNSPAASWVTDAAGVMRYASAVYMRTAPAPPDLIGKRVADLYAPEFAAELMRNIRHVAETRSVLETTERAPRADGSIGTFLVYKFPLRREDGAVDVGGVAVDITDRVRAETALRLSEERYRLIAEHSADLIQLIDLAAGRITYASPSHEAVLGCDPTGQVCLADESCLHPDDRGKAHELWDRLLEHGGTSGVLRLAHRDGGHRWIELTARRMTAPSERLAVLVGRDVTARLKLEQQYLQSQKMESIGRLAGGVAHDFNNLLTAVNGIAELALQDAAENTQLHQDLREILRIVERGSNLTRQLLAFARTRPFDPSHVDLNTLIAETGSLLRRTFDRAIAISIVPGAVPAPVRVDPGQIEQVIMNLAVNARDAMPDGGRLTIAVETVVLGRQEARDVAPPVEPGAFARLTVADSGTGMAPEVRERAIEPFYTTKQVGKGTGLGLATCYAIARQHGGGLQIASVAGRGTTVTIYLPLASAAEASVALPPEEWRGLAGSEHIWLVEDDAAVRRFVGRGLAALGYRVTVATSGEEALALPGADPPDLIVTDVMLGTISGPQTVERLRERGLGARVLYISGYTNDEHATSGSEFLAKPFGVAELARKLRAMLDDGARP